MGCRLSSKSVVGRKSRRENGVVDELFKVVCGRGIRLIFET